MSILPTLQVSGDTLPNTDDPPIAHHDLLAGVPRERVDPHTLEVLQLLFRGKGMQFLAVFLHLAQAKQCPLPGLPGTTACAVITARSIRQLAERIGWGYDTTEKYLVVLVALHFLYKEKSRDGIEYYFPLCRYAAPDSLDELDDVIRHYREKVQSFGKKARRRFLVYLEQRKSPFSPPIPLTSSPSAFDLPAVEEDIELIMREELGDGILLQRLLLKVKGTLRYRCQLNPNQIPVQKGDLVAPSLPEKSPLSEQKGNFSSESPQQESPLSKKGNSFVAKATRNGRLLDQKGDFISVRLETTSLEKSPLSEQKGDSQTGSFPSNGRLLPQNGNLSSPKGDFSPEQPPNVNVISNILDSLNVNVKGVIEYLRTTFDEEPKKRGFYYSLYKQYQQSDAWLAATIETLLAYHKQKTQQPGKYFYDLCVFFHKNGIPQEVAERVQQYGHLTHEQLLVALVHPPASATPSPAAASSTSTRPSQSQRPQIVLHIAREKDRPGLTEHDARQARELIRSDERTCTLRVVPYRQSDGSFVLLVDNGTTKHPRQIWIYTLRECQARLTTMKLQKDFFQEGVTI